MESTFEIAVKKFETGAVRSGDADGQRHDLMSPIAIREVEAHISSNPHLVDFGETKKLVSEARLRMIETSYISMQSVAFKRLMGGTCRILRASHQERDGKDNFKSLIPPRGLIAYAEAMAEGAAKYTARNWLKGFPVYDLINHAIRHLTLWEDGDVSEDHLGHAVWNAMSAVHFWITRTDLLTGLAAFSDGSVEVVKKGCEGGCRRAKTEAVDFAVPGETQI